MMVSPASTSSWIVVGIRSSVPRPSSSLARMAAGPTAVASAYGISSYTQSSAQCAATASKSRRSRSTKSWRKRSALRLINRTPFAQSIAGRARKHSRHRENKKNDHGQRRPDHRLIKPGSVVSGLDVGGRLRRDGANQMVLETSQPYSREADMSDLKDLERR